jgi:predicted transglutaminase-like cysteine proteinase
MRRVLQRSPLGSLHVLLSIFLVLSTGFSTANAAFRPGAEHIRFDVPVLAPMAYSQFCLRYPADCRVRKIFRGGPIRVSVAKRAELAQVNDTVNAGIVSEANEQGLAGEVWLIGPDRGDCNDYAVTKRHALLARGWPARALLLSEVVVADGEHHLVLVVRTTDGDLVLDSLTRRIRPWFKVPYRWVRMQVPGVARLWSTIAARSV